MKPKSAPEKAHALVLLGAYYVHNPYPKTHNLSSALKLANEAADISAKAGLARTYNEAKLLTAFAYLRKFNLDSAVLVLPSLNDSTRFVLLLNLAQHTRNHDNAKNRLEKGMNYAQQALLIANKLNDTLKKVLAMKEVSCIESEKISPDAEVKLLRIVALLKELQYPYLQYIYYELAGFTYLLGSEDKAFYYSDLALRATAASKDSAGYGDFCVAHGVILAKSGEHQKSITYLKQAIEFYKIRYGNYDMTQVLRQLVDEYIKLKQFKQADSTFATLYQKYPPDNAMDSMQWLNSMGNFYRLAKRYNKAETCYLSELAIRTRNNIDPDYHAVGQLYVEAGKFRQAKFYLEKALQQVDSTTSIRTKGHLHYCLFLADSATGNYLSAMRHLRENKRWDDSMITQSKTAAIQKYQTQYETQKKEDSLRHKDDHISLLTRTNLLQDDNLRQANLVKRFTIAGIVLAGVIIVLLYRQYRNKQKSNLLIGDKNQKLERLVTEKEWLLKEVHHRVKNNLQTIMSLLELQAGSVNEDAQFALQTSQNRIYATSLLHQKLYRSDNLSSVNMEVYLNELLQHLKASLSTVQSVSITTHITPIELDVTQGVPIGLMVNEIITNAFKYAFDETIANPQITVSLTTDGHVADLVIADNGLGFQKADEVNLGLGLKLVQGLAEDIDGKATILSHEGTTVMIRFKPRHALQATIEQTEIINKAQE
ncbi:histidine kinase dimerization/phosphoacceptor domain -containing protein [Paraflavitalea pollutisoli]|uniref:histidine kinase dimerization/phosphoacceptor domain -containing protein n=1 Tax=Paraflavitalea pollutisoli TaxID=3034143 RepID=UPI0023EB3671|nr:histidine kinase dimerization/phosphoacceptor domain -containing protein [Paraflavitalea sp. H1-2-19X]